MSLVVRKRKTTVAEQRTNWWKMKKEECCKEFREKFRQAVGGQEQLPGDWETTGKVIRETGL